ncbi:hypothetical protein DYD21_01645 [Rhodohalobacter sp. SW132]|uniref:hypothetical protein n=1 Tax=Rhodohalobacter sp. SW132 TaxID=2293433 RepID=UPI000E2420A3|nr:hypothetical protein [Rhodohalobacter sp. SW132]REL38679.1 hypothetical protein DYD21_01645 [Rhodohalobacter sp. SW132]
MDKSVLLKIIGILIASFLVITLVTFFLFPYLNEQKYEQIQTERLQSSVDEQVFTDVDLMPESNISGTGRFAYLQQELLRQKQENRNWENRVDSVLAVQNSVEQERDSLFTELENLKEQIEQGGGLIAGNRQDADSGNDVEMVAAADEPTEEFSERVKSLLNLDEEELKPIANQMTQDELVRIYRHSGNIQREKLLRSLNPERAAKLMREIML